MNKKDKPLLGKLSDSYKNLIAWYIGLGTWGRVLIAALIIFIMGGFIIIMIPTLKIEKPAGGLPSLLDQKPKLPSLINNIGLPSLLTKAKSKPIATFQDYLCKMVYDYNMTNMTLGSTTCYKYEEFGYDCICLTPIS